jgi:hypothetical protein
LPLDEQKGFASENPFSALAALPLGVRKGCAFPKAFLLSLAATPPDERKGFAFP